jgi:hypothetical protein
MYVANKLSRLFQIAAISMLSFTVSSCDKDDDDEDKMEVEITASANGAQEVPAVTTNGTGTVSGIYNKTTNVFAYTVTWKDLSGPAINMHFHGPADPGTPAGVALAIIGFATEPMGTVTASVTLTDAQETEMLGGKWYYNVHTDLHKGGEIRGQMTVK